MKHLFQAAAVLAALVSGAANATTFDFSYTFSDGLALTGSLDGTQSGNNVANISNVNITFNGNSYSGSLFAGAYDSASNSYNYSNGAAIVSSNAAQNNFMFADSNDPQGLGVSNWFYFVNGSSPSGSGGTQEVFAANAVTGDIDFDNPASGKWSLNAAPVPLPAALPLFVSGLGLLGFKRRRGTQGNVAHA